ncbi:MAG: hypothetical protein LBP87_15640 [Planctomycetaceae bacterium]|nr:hypothetical protein [Planctomycetaceae bacterium]
MSCLLVFLQRTAIGFLPKGCLNPMVVTVDVVSAKSCRSLDFLPQPVYKSGVYAGVYKNSAE